MSERNICSISVVLPKCEEPNWPSCLYGAHVNSGTCGTCRSGTPWPSRSRFHRDGDPEGSPGELWPVRQRAKAHQRRARVWQTYSRDYLSLRPPWRLCWWCSIVKRRWCCAWSWRPPAPSTWTGRRWTRNSPRRRTPGGCLCKCPGGHCGWSHWRLGWGAERVYFLWKHSYFPPIFASVNKKKQLSCHHLDLHQLHGTNAVTAAVLIEYIWYETLALPDKSCVLLCNKVSVHCWCIWMFLWGYVRCRWHPGAGLTSS